MGMLGAYNRFGPSRIEERAINDRKAFGDSLQALLEYEWDGIVMPHGDLIHEGGRAHFQSGFGSYLPEP